MKKFSNMKLKRYSETLLQANNILKIARHLHDNVDTVSKCFDDTAEDIYSAQAESTGKKFLYNHYTFKTGEKKTVHDHDEEGKEIAGTEREEDVKSSVDIFDTSEDAAYKRISTYYVMNNKPISIAFSLAVPTTYKYQSISTKTKDSQHDTFKLRDFDEYSTEENLNKEAWMFRTMSIDIQLAMAYLAKHKCPGIEIYFSDVDKVMELLELTPSTIDDIVELN